MNPINFLLFALCSLLFVVNVSYAAQPSQKIKIALFPFENLSEDKSALTSVMPVLRSRLEARGLEMLDEDGLNRFLLKERVRSTGYISRDMAQKIGKELDVKAILLGSINSFFSKENPQIGLSARLIDSSNGLILWADHASATGDDFTTILGLGRVKTMERLIPIVVDSLFASFSTVVPSKEIGYTYRVAVMPFQNKSRVRDAGMIATYMFLVELFKNRRFETVEYGEVRRLIVDLRVRYKGELDHKSIEALSEFLGVDGILVGTVELYTEGLDTSPPEVGINARLIDAHKNRILWYESYQLSGDEDIIAFDWGRIMSVDNVAYKVVSKLVKKMETAKWH